MDKLVVFFLILLSTGLFADEESEFAEIMPKFTDTLYLGAETNGTIEIAVGERGHIAVSDDYGASWIQAKNVPTRTTLTAISMVNNHSWAVGHDTTVLYSSDNGITWTKQFEDKERQMPLLDVLFINESEGFAVGAYGTYLTTMDGGKNWNDSLIYTDEDYHINKIIQVDEFKLFAVAEAGKAYRSFDLGKNWESLDMPYKGSMFGAVYFDNQIITYGLRGNVLVSDDFGSTFEQIESPIQNSLFASEHTFNNKLLIVGANGSVLQYRSNRLTKVNVAKNDGDYTGLLSIKNDKLLFLSETGLSTKDMR
ncbi:MAG: WD40/YVTN/BNR-like repeat-containing protein [Marinicellaceae bacterium]